MRHTGALISKFAIAIPQCLRADFEKFTSTEKVRYGAVGVAVVGPQILLLACRNFNSTALARSAHPLWCARPPS